MNAPLFFASAGDERSTPQKFFDTLNDEFHFDIDCAADELNHKCDLWFGKGGVAFDALAEDWSGMTCFLNPPYSVAGAFVAKAREEADKGATVVLLLPVRSDTRYWHKYVWDRDALVRTNPVLEKAAYARDGNWRPGVRCRFIPGRLNFELHVPETVREWIRTEVASTAYIEYAERSAKIGALVRVTGLPKMAIARILKDLPDEDLLDAAPFPSCVVIFTRAV